MNTEFLRAISFLIRLPDCLGIADGTRFPVEEPDDRGMPNVFRYVTEEGISVCWRMHFEFYQSLSTGETIDEACFRVFDRLYSANQEENNQVAKKATTVVKATFVIGEVVIDETTMTLAYDCLIKELSEIQKAYYIQQKVPIRLVTVQNTAPIAPCVVEIVDANCIVSEVCAPEISLFAANTFFENNAYKEIVAQENIQDLLHIIKDYSDTSRGTFFSVQREALLAQRDGNAMLFGLLAGMASEILFDDLLMMMLWEEGVVPRDAYELFQSQLCRTTSDRIGSHLFESRLGGIWAIDGKKAPIRNWRYRIRDVRNKIIHTGYQPTPADMSNAVTALSQLIDYICDLLCSNIASYPITAYTLVGRSSIEKRECSDDFDAVIKKYSNPRNPIRVFNNWRFEVDRFSDLNPSIGKYSKADLICLFHMNGQEAWFLQDVSKRLVTRIPDQIVGRLIRESLDSIKQSVIAGGCQQNVIIKIFDHKPEYKKDTGIKWIPSYCINPLYTISRWPVSYILPE